MSNTSATGGYLIPSITSPPLEDDALDLVFQKLVVGITGLVGNLVRPRWQTIEPKQPEPNINWCSFGVVDVTPDDNASVEHDGDKQVDNLARHETIEMLFSFYGPNRNYYAQLLRDGLAIAQNREQLQINLMAFIYSATMRIVPELVNQQWVKRSDLPIIFRRKIERVYDILNIGSVIGDVLADSSSTIITRHISV